MAEPCTLSNGSVVQAAVIGTKTRRTQQARRKIADESAVKRETGGVRIPPPQGGVYSCCPPPQGGGNDHPPLPQGRGGDKLKVTSPPANTAISFRSCNETAVSQSFERMSAPSVRKFKFDNILAAENHGANADCDPKRMHQNESLETRPGAHANDRRG